PVLFPADGRSVPLTSYDGGESPDPLANCPGYTVPTGLPILAQFVTTPNVSNSSLTRNGAPVEHCVFAPTGGSDPLGQRHHAVILPRTPLLAGSTYEASLTVNGQTTTWGFTVCP